MVRREGDGAALPLLQGVLIHADGRRHPRLPVRSVLVQEAADLSEDSRRVWAPNPGHRSARNPRASHKRWHSEQRPEGEVHNPKETD